MRRSRCAPFLSVSRRAFSPPRPVGEEREKKRGCGIPRLGKRGVCDSTKKCCDDRPAPLFYDPLKCVREECLQSQ